ncbi:uncharacterized protein LOC6040288 isoform X2 [Culex quinquefasciatus]|uniref:uncharacterized protein LOC6040288 isoform X2 n=1 Tax=Culex quinquefasciatus TaxID=7176 RepID=UPI0018E29690|nr:uncharacterized protein LOC6040288 isoform X2 [Culex quinquefasciatus]
MSNAAVPAVDGDDSPTVSETSKATYPHSSVLITSTYRITSLPIVQVDSPSEAFEVPLDDADNADSLIRKHPPKRLQRLEEQPGSPPTIDELEEKLATAEMRRQQFLASRSQKTLTLDKTGQEENGDVDVIKEEDEPGEEEAKNEEGGEEKCDDEKEKEEMKVEES